MTRVCWTRLCQSSSVFRTTWLTLTWHLHCRCQMESIYSRCLHRTWVHACGNAFSKRNHVQEVLFQASKFHLLLGKSEGFSVSQIRKERDTISHHLLSAGQQPRPWQDLSVSLAFLSFWQLLELSADSVQFSLWPCIWFYAMPCCLTERFLAWLHCSPITQKLLAFCSPGKGRLCIPLHT